MYEIKNSAILDNFEIDLDMVYGNSLFILPGIEYYDHIKQKIINRFSSEDLVYLEYNGQKAILINAELDERVGVNMGFDEDVIKKAIDNGFKVALSFQNENFGNVAFLSEIEYLISTYEISYVEINSFEFPGYEDAIEEAIDIIEKSEATLMLKADYGKVNPNSTDGLYDYIYKTDFDLHRTFFIENYLLNSNIVTPREYYLVMLRAAVDRGNRFFVITPLTNLKKIFSETLEDIETTVRLFYERLGDEYDFHGYVEGISFSEISFIYSYFSALAIIFAVLLILINAFPKIKSFYILFIMFVIGYGVFGVIYTQYFARLNALLGTIVFPSLFAFFLVKESRREKVELLNYIFKIVPAFFIFAALSIVSSIVNLSTVQTFVGINTFVGVKFSFVIPLLMFVVFYYVDRQSMNRIFSDLIAIGKKPVTYFSITIMLIAAVAIYIYLIRSGNDSGNLVSSYEIKIREFFEELMLTRPRTKEILVGYPSLALLVYFSRREKREAFIFIFGAGVMVGLISLINTFSHVNAYVNVAISRSMNGIVFGALVAAVLVSLIYFVERMVKKHRKAGIDE